MPRRAAVALGAVLAGYGALQWLGRTHGATRGVKTRAESTSAEDLAALR
jgi:hypothetical protein